MQLVTGKDVEAATPLPRPPGVASPPACQGASDQPAESAAQRRKRLLQSTARLEQTGQLLAEGRKQMAETEVLQCATTRPSEDFICFLKMLKGAAQSWVPSLLGVCSAVVVLAAGAGRERAGGAQGAAGCSATIARCVAGGGRQCQPVAGHLETDGTVVAILGGRVCLSVAGTGSRHKPV